MDYNVLVLAMSTLHASSVSSKSVTRYRLKRDGRLEEGVYEGVGQMEAVPIMLHRKLSDKGCRAGVTHILILETKKAREPIEHNKDAREALRLLKAHYGNIMDLEQLGQAATITHVDFFKTRMSKEGIHPRYDDIRIDDDDDPSPAFEELQTKIRDLYAECTAAGGSWHLWIDTHGAFREVSMIMVGLMQMLAAPDGQDLARYVEGEPLKSGVVASMSDGLSTVPIEALYCSEYDPTRRDPDDCQVITDRTDFYKTFTKPAITAYMNYGQYVRAHDAEVQRPARRGGQPAALRVRELSQRGRAQGAVRPAWRPQAERLPLLVRRLDTPAAEVGD